jgi:hypothetical protein
LNEDSSYNAQLGQNTVIQLIHLYRQNTFTYYTSPYEMDSFFF